jgi:hypothetical protein
MNVVIAVRVSLTKYQTITFIMNGIIQENQVGCGWAVKTQNLQNIQTQGWIYRK